MFVQMFSRALTEDELLVHTKLAEAAIACGRADVVIPKLKDSLRCILIASRYGSS